jgi:RNA polymerase sigma-70 factor (ECF subfamily)
MSSPVPNLTAPELPVAAPTASTDEPLSFSAVYEARFHDVVRWARAMGGRDEDLDDLAQEIFIIVRRKLATFDGTNLQGWLYRITQRTVRDYRRAAWFRNLLTRKRVADHEHTLLKLVEPGRGPAEEQELREAQQSLKLILDRMRDKHRTAFVLFELEGYTGEEIAELEGAQVGTVFTRLFHARREFAAIVKQLRKDRRLG